MNELITILPLLIGGLAAVTAIDSVGAIASRKLNFKYEYLAILQMGVYFLLGYMTQVNLPLTLLLSLIVGFYDGTIGLKLSQKFKPNSIISNKEVSSISQRESLWAMLIVSPLLAFIGYIVK